MQETLVIYLGRHVSKDNFRTNIYDSKGQKKLVESWDAYQVAMQTGLWFPTLEEATASMLDVQEMEKNESDIVMAVKPKSKSKPISVKIEKTERENSKISANKLDNMVFEVTDENK